MWEFYNQLKEAEFKPMLFSLYNILDDNYYFQTLNRKHNTIYSIDDFECFEFPLTKKKSEMVKRRNSEFLDKFRQINDRLKNDAIVVYDYQYGKISVVKLKGKSLFE